MIAEIDKRNAFLIMQLMKKRVSLKEFLCVKFRIKETGLNIR